MFSLRTLLITALPLLVLSSKPEQCSSQPFPHHGSPMLASLQCYNDFTTHIRCSWEEEPNTRFNVSNSNGKPCELDGHSKLQSNGKLTQSCVYKTQVFSMSSHAFYFSINCPSKVTTLTIAARGKILPPTNFSEKKENGGNQRLSWSSPYPPSSPLSLNLIYQLKYRRHKHEWIVVDHINVTEYVINRQALLLGYSYEAKVRARGFIGSWSDWSPKVVWMTEEEGVINLQCVVMEGGVICSWQVKKWQASFLSYHLCGHANGKNLTCNHCASHAEHHLGTFLDFTCSLENPEPELLTMEIRSLRKAKVFSNPDNIQPLPPQEFQVKKNDGVWILSWTRPNVSEKLTLSYQVYLESNDKKDKVHFTLSDGELSAYVPSSLWPSTGYTARVRAIPSQDFAGRPSDWSDPISFTTDPALWMNTMLYVLIALLVATLFVIFYNALPACHRRLVRWNISIPSPINSKVLGEMSNKGFLAGETNHYTGSEKTSVFVIQTSDNPIICKSSISENPLLKCGDDMDMDRDMRKSGWPKGSSHSSLFSEGSRRTDKSGISFTGPYILCRENSSVPSETSDTFSSLLTLDDDGRYIPESPKDSLPIKGGYVLSPPKSSESSSPINSLASENREPRNSELPDDDPPAYTPSPTVVSSAIFSHPSGYCLMPNMDIVAAWVSDSVPPPEGSTERKLYKTEGVSPERSYVTLSQRGL